MNKNFYDCCRQWLDGISDTVSPATSHRYENLIKVHILPFFGEQKVEDITEQEMKEFVNKKKQEALSASSLRMIVQVLKKILESSRDYGALPKMKQELDIGLPKDETQMLSEADEKVLEGYLNTERSETSLAVALSLKMGLLLGEVCGLRWCDVNLLERKLCVNHLIQRFPSKEEGKKTELVQIEPSGENQLRTIPIPDTVYDQFLVQHLKWSESGNRQEYIISGSAEKMPDPRTLQYRFRKVLAKYELPTYKFAALRHTFGMNCVKSGMNIVLLSKLMGINENTAAMRYAVKYQEAEEEQIARFMNC